MTSKCVERRASALSSQLPLRSTAKSSTSATRAGAIRRSSSAFLQRVGRSGHSVGGTPKGRLFALSRDDLVECTALLDAVRRGELDTLHVERDALDVLAQQIVAEVASREWNEAELFELLTRAYPFSDLSRSASTDIVGMLPEGFPP